jgi:hypothetical protein
MNEIIVMKHVGPSSTKFKHICGKNTIDAIIKSLKASSQVFFGSDKRMDMCVYKYI